MLTASCRGDLLPLMRPSSPAFCPPPPAISALLLPVFKPPPPAFLADLHPPPPLPKALLLPMIRDPPPLFFQTSQVV